MGFNLNLQWFKHLYFNKHNYYFYSCSINESISLGIIFDSGNL